MDNNNNSPIIFIVEKSEAPGAPIKKKTSRRRIVHANAPNTRRKLNFNIDLEDLPDLPQQHKDLVAAA